MRGVRKLTEEDLRRVAAIRALLSTIPPRPYKKVAYNWKDHGPTHWSGAIHSANGPQGPLGVAKVYRGAGSFYALDEPVVDFLVRAPEDLEWLLRLLEDFGLGA